MSSFISMLVRHGGNSSRIAKVRDINDFPSNIGSKQSLLTPQAQESAFKMCKNLLSLYGELVQTRYIKGKSKYFNNDFLEKCISRKEFESLNSKEQKIVQSSITTAINDKLKDLENSLSQYHFSEDFLLKNIKLINNESLLYAMLLLSQSNEEDKSISLYVSLRSSNLQETIRDQMIFSEIRKNSDTKREVSKEITKYLKDQENDINGYIEQSLPSLIEIIKQKISKNLEDSRNS